MEKYVAGWGERHNHARGSSVPMPFEQARRWLTNEIEYNAEKWEQTARLILGPHKLPADCVTYPTALEKIRTAEETVAAKGQMYIRTLDHGFYIEPA